MVRHLTSTRDLPTTIVEHLLSRAQTFLDEKHRDTLKGKTIINMFFENSTRTRGSFEIAAKRLGAEVVNLDIGSSSTKKGETLVDTAMNLDAMGPSAIIVRHKSAGVPELLTHHVRCSIINGGDGAHAHPTQALLDLLTLKRSLGDLEGKKIAIIGDIKNSRVANSNLELLPRFGIEPILVAPPHFLPAHTTFRTASLPHEIIDDVDAIMSLRTQTERHEYQTYGSLEDYGRDYCITPELLEDRPLVVLHPGPVHRNIDISDAVLADPRSKVLEQVKNGVAMRMAVLEYLIIGVTPQQ